MSRERRDAIIAAKQGGGVEATLQAKTVSPNLAEGNQVITPDAGNDGMTQVTLTKDTTNHVATNIKSGVTLYGVEGSLSSLDTSDATAAAGDILNGETAYVNGSKVTGTMANKADNDVEVTDTTGTTIPAGYYNGTGKAKLSSTEAAKVITGNIKSGVTLLGVSGSSSVVDTSDADAVAGDIASGKYAYVNGTKLTGTATGGGITNGVSWDAFDEANNVTEATIYGTVFPTSALDGQGYLTEIVIPEGTLKVGDYACRYCYGATTINNPTTITEIGTQAYGGCEGITKIWIPISCVTIAGETTFSSPFYECLSDLTVYCEAESKPAGWGDYWNYYDETNQLSVVWGVSKAEFDAL